MPYALYILQTPSPRHTDQVSPPPHAFAAAGSLSRAPVDMRCGHRSFPTRHVALCSLEVDHATRKIGLSGSSSSLLDDTTRGEKIWPSWKLLSAVVTSVSVFTSMAHRWFQRSALARGLNYFLSISQASRTHGSNKHAENIVRSARQFVYSEADVDVLDYRGVANATPGLRSRSTCILPWLLES